MEDLQAIMKAARCFMAEVGVVVFAKCALAIAKRVMPLSCSYLKNGICSDIQQTGTRKVPTT